MSVIFRNSLNTLMHQKDGASLPVWFKIKFTKRSTGAIVVGECCCTSSNYASNTVNVKFKDSGQIRTIRTILIKEFNDIKVLL